jgi:hypothetical protein
VLPGSGALGASASLSRANLVPVADSAVKAGLSITTAVVAVALAAEGFTGDVVALWATAQAIAA